MHIPGTKGNPQGKYLIVGEYWGVEEDKQKKPFVGSSGKELDKILQEAGIPLSECFFTCVVNTRPPGGDMAAFLVPTKDAKRIKMDPYKGVYPKTELLHGLAALREVIDHMKPELIIGLGNWPLWALTSEAKITNSKKPYIGYKVPTGIASFRGSQLYTPEGEKLLVTYHPATVMKQSDWRHLVVHDIRARAKLLHAWSEPVRDYIIRPSFEQVMNYLTQLQVRAELTTKPFIVANDIETRTLYYPRNNDKHAPAGFREIECVGFAHNTASALCVPILETTKSGSYWSPEEERAVIREMQAVLEHPKIEICGQNFQYDFQHYRGWWGIQPNYKHDTMLAHHTCFPGMRMGLDFISSMYCSFHKYWKDDGKMSTDEYNDEQRWTYNCRDCVVTYEAIHEIAKALDVFGLLEQYAFQMHRARAATNMMMRGMRLNEKKRGDETLRALEAAMELGNKIISLMPEDLYTQDSKKTPWYRSNTQLGELLYDVLLEKEIFDRKTGNRTVNDAALHTIGMRNPILRPLVENIQAYRSLETFQGFLKMTTDLDGRARTTFSPTTETFRYRSSDTAFGTGRNMQNIPAGNEEYTSDV